MTLDQKFLKAAHIRPDDPAAENWMDWRSEEVSQLRATVAEHTRREYIANEEAKKREKRMNMWILAAFAGWLLAILIGSERLWKW